MEWLPKSYPSSSTNNPHPCADRLDIANICDGLRYLRGGERGTQLYTRPAWTMPWSDVGRYVDLSWGREGRRSPRHCVMALPKRRTRPPVPAFCQV